MAPLLEIIDLDVVFQTRRKALKAIDNLSVTMEPGEILGFVGESGAGKSVTGAAIMGLIDPPGYIAGGEIKLKGRPVADYGTNLRGKEVGMIFQDPLTSLNPLRTIGDHGDVVRAAVGLHPSFCTTDEPDSPHLAVPSYTGSLYVGFGSADTMQPAAANAALIQATNALDKGAPSASALTA